MNWQQWVLVAWYCVVALVCVGRIGQERKPTTPTEAVFSLVLIAVLVGLVVTA